MMINTIEGLSLCVCLSVDNERGRPLLSRAIHVVVSVFYLQEADNDPTGEAAQVAQQMLTFYELDLGLNHVVRKYSEPLEDTANMLITVPGGNDGPSGVLICCENYLIYKNFGDQADLRCPIPRRQHDLDDAERSMLFVCSATHKTKVSG